MADEYKYLNQGSLGKLFNVSSHEIGRWLTRLGLKEGNRPSWLAHRDEYVESAPTGRGDGYYYVWDREKTVTALVEAGHQLFAEERKSNPTHDALLVGPFECRQSSEDGYGIVSGDGIVSVWVRGETNSTFVTSLLNRAYEWGKIRGVELNKVAQPSY